jgi:DNA-binding transcriptional ArsR family regulator
MPRSDTVCRDICFNEKLVASIRKRINGVDFGVLAEIYKLLANSMRLKIIFALEKGELCVCDVANAIGLSIPATSQQLKLLRLGKIVRFRTDGKMAYYSLVNPNLFDAIQSDTRFIAGHDAGRKQIVTA